MYIDDIQVKDRSNCLTHNSAIKQKILLSGIHLFSLSIDRFSSILSFVSSCHMTDKREEIIERKKKKRVIQEVY